MQKSTVEERAGLYAWLVEQKRHDDAYAVTRAQQRSTQTGIPIDLRMVEWAKELLKEYRSSVGAADLFGVKNA